MFWFPGWPGPASAAPPAGHAVLVSPVGAGGLMMPPEIPGVPSMPAPPDWFASGAPRGGGLFQPLVPVAPVDPGNQVRQMQQQVRLA